MSTSTPETAPTTPGLPAWLDRLPGWERAPHPFRVKARGGGWYGAWTDGHTLLMGTFDGAEALPPCPLEPGVVDFIASLPAALAGARQAWHAERAKLLAWATPPDVPRTPCPACDGRKQRRCRDCGGRGERRHTCTECDDTHTGPCRGCRSGMADCATCRTTGQFPPLPAHYLGLLLGQEVDRLKILPLLPRLEDGLQKLALLEGTSSGAWPQTPVVGRLERLALVMPMFVGPKLGAFTDTEPPWTEPAVRPTTPGAWRRSGDTGESSMTVWSALMGVTVERASFPYDAGDFGRCYRLLHSIPGWRQRVPEVALAYPSWAPLVEAWDELERLYLEEAPFCDTPRFSARLLEALSHPAAPRSIP
jgi:hypothetical protein